MTSGDLQSKVTRAIRAYLLTAGVVTETSCHAEPDSRERVLPLEVIGVAQDGTQDLNMPGNVHFPDIRVLIEDTGVLQPDQALDTARVNANNHIAAVRNALWMSDDTVTYDYMARSISQAAWNLASNPATAADNSDMADFQMIWWNPVFEGAVKESTGEKGTFWARELGFACIVANAAFP